MTNRQTAADKRSGRPASLISGLFRRLSSLFARFANWLGSLNSTNWVYLLIHGLLFIGGLLLVELETTGSGSQVESTLVSAVGVSLVATGVTGWALFIWVSLNEGRSRRAELVSELGIVNAFSGRAAQIRSEYDDRLKNANQAIDVLGFGLRQMRQDYGKQFAVWAARAPVRILLLNPNAPNKENSYARQRDREEGNSPVTITDDVKQFLEETHALWSDPKSGFSVRLYSALPSVNIFRVDNELFWGPYFIKRQSRNTPTFVVRRGGTLFEDLVRHFEDLWEHPELSSEPAPIIND